MQFNLPNPPQSLVEACLAGKAVSSSNNPPSNGLFVEGRRNNDFASLAGFMRSRGANAEEIYKNLQAFNASITTPLSDDEISNISKSISRYSITPDIFTHDRFAKQLAEQLVDKVRYCDECGFFVYQDGYWQRDTKDNKVLALVRHFISELRADIETCRGSDPEGYEKLKKAIKRLESASFMRESMKLLKTENEIQVEYSDFDKNQHLINLANGTLNLRTMKLQEFEPADHLTTKLDFAYDAKADCPKFKKFLSEILDKDVADFLLRVMGYSLLGHGREQKFFILVGKGKNGKSTFIEVIEDIFGSMAVTIQPDSLNGKQDGSIRNDLARLAGKRLMITSETKAGTVLDAPLLKQITGQDTLSARFLHQEFFEFKARCVMAIISNHLPVLDGSDSAMERRVIVINFDKVIEKVDTKLAEKLKGEKAGIFNLILKSLKTYEVGGLAIPASVRNQTKAFVDRSNLIQTFFADCLSTQENARITASTMHHYYKAWCFDNGYKPMSQNIFKDSFQRETGLEQRRDNKGRYWPDLQYKPLI